MSDPRPTTPYTTQRGAIDAATASVGPAAAAEVRPDPRLRTAFLTQAFVWMFVGLLLSAERWRVDRGSPSLTVSRSVVRNTLRDMLRAKSARLCWRMRWAAVPVMNDDRRKEAGRVAEEVKAGRAN